VENNASDTLMFKQHDAINMLEQSELEAARLYDMFSRWFPELASFWVARAREEREHAGIIHSFGKNLQSNTCDLGGHEFKIVEIKHWLKKIRNNLDYMKKLDHYDHDLSAAYSLAVELEEGLLEHHLFGVDSCGSDDLKSMLKRLRADTAVHLEMFKKGYQQVQV
jgi:rubrerythrin